MAHRPGDTPDRDSAAVLARLPDSPNAFGTGQSAAIKEWLASASEEQLRALFTTGLSLYELGELGMSALTPLAENSNGLMTDVVAGNPIRVTARFLIRREDYDLAAGTAHVSVRKADAQEYEPIDYQAASIIRTELPSSQDGSLDFGDGQVISLWQLMVRAYQGFGLSATTDNRLTRRRSL